MNKPIYQTVLLKISGESLAAGSESIVSSEILDEISKQVANLIKMQIKVGIVIGGGNLFRGKDKISNNIDRVTSDYMGMLGTNINSLALQSSLEKSGVCCEIMSAIPIEGMINRFDRRKAIRYLNEGSVVVFSGGTGNPLVTTDTAASLRAIEINADVLIKATDVDGIFNKNPKTNSDALKYDEVSYQEVLDKELGVMDLAAFAQCRDHEMKIVVYNIDKTDALANIVIGKKEGTLVS